MYRDYGFQDLAQLSITLARERGHWDKLIMRHWDFASLLEAQRTLPKLAEICWAMKKKIAASKKKEVKKAEFKGFANIELSVEDKATMKEWIKNVEAVQVEIDEMAASGYKVTFQRSEATGGYQATAFCMDSESPNGGYILSAFAPHWWDAICCLVYKHAIYAEGVWPIDTDTIGDVWG